MLSLANVMYLLADELAGLRGWSLPGALVLTSAFQRGSFRHNNPPILYSYAVLPSAKRATCAPFGAAPRRRLEITEGGGAKS
jgi:hypothetical protein